MIYDDGRRMDGKEYVEDSTRGNAVINPKTVKADLMVQCWLPRSELAALAVWLEDNGERPRFMSEAVRSILHMVHENLITNGEIQAIDDPVLASDILMRIFKISVELKRRGKRNLLHNKILYDRKVASGAVDTRMADAIEEGIRKMRQMEEEEKLAKQALEKDYYLKKVKVDNDGLVINETMSPKPTTISEVMLPKPIQQSIQQPLGQSTNPNDRFTLRKMTLEELEAKAKALAEKDRLQQQLMNEELKRMKEMKNE